MTAVTKTISGDDTVIQDIGRVRAVRGDRFAIEAAPGDPAFVAQRAVSCLVEPTLGDAVLFAGKPSGSLYILAVLERDDDAVTLRAPGDLTVQVDAGRFTVASKGVDVVSSEDISLTSSEVQVRASRSKVFVRRVELLSERIFGETEALKLVASKVERIAERVVDRVGRSYRFVEEMDQLRAGSIEHVAEETIRLKGEHAFLQADGLTKVDGDQIHLG